ncbi:S8 family serine peptidase [Ramlibacter sp. XY19]|uniref:S8 family peptidase n=1 Tax=Ramlibacter paludis TaxID=2908000 RepID=UPI0023DAEBF2|nr:S8 family peptidase [Ramlibacter paludis]MCG2591944.1 S8 family serine peptidase [Ramlibacter paludis]
MIPVSRKRPLAIVSLLAAALLAACGGGSDSPAPSASAQSGTALMADVQSQAAATGEVTSQPVDSDRGTRRGNAAPATNRAYIVQMDELPASAYDGRTPGLKATKPSKGQKLDSESPAVANYIAHLASKHDAALQKVGNARKLYSYGYVFNGFAAELTDAQAQKLAATKGVVSVTKDELRQMDTASTPSFLGLAGSTGFWAKTGATGEGVVIGMVDSGIWPESESFSDRTGTNGNETQDGKLSYQNIPGWKGKCINGDQFNNSMCNQKLIGARYYNSGFGGNAGVMERWGPTGEFNSPRDWGGHGTHTASTAGGNSGVTVTGPAAPFGKISGMAPRARISVYKVCWSETALGGGCFGSDSVAAIEQAIADGVDVINFSISGSTTNFRDPVEIAFMYAADAGVFVATSAGNSGPTVSTVAHPSPWLTTVAAGTHNRAAIGTVTLGNGAVYTGASLAANAVSGAFIDSQAAALPGADPTAARLCFSTSWAGAPVLDPAKVSGKIVLCDRGTNDRVNKSLAVQEAGGIGMVLVNTSPNTLNADYHVVPTVHIADTARTAVKAYAATTGATAAISQSTLDFSAAAPFTASFSSRGPSLAAGGSVLKPDIIAPGQDILAAVAPPGNGGRNFDLYSGTSMSSPHIAGIAALFKQLNPSWSPMAIKSALMTTAGDVLDGPNTNPLVIFRQGAGHVKPSAALDPGLVFDSNIVDWIGFLCGTQLPASYCAANGIPVVDPTNMNVASIALGALPGTQTITRRVTNVSNSSATYTASYTGMAGFTVAVAPASLVIAPGQTKNVTVTITRTSAALNAYGGGQLTLTDGTHKVRVPMVARPVALGAPAEVTGSYNVTFGYDGAFSATARGLVPAVKASGSVATDGTADFLVTVPAGMSHVRFSTFDSDVSQASDIDMEVYNSAGTLVGSSGGSTAQEEVNIRNPAADTYRVRVVGFAVPSGAASFNLYSWVLGTAAAGNMTVSAPATAVTGQTGAITITTNSLAAGTKYMGSVVYGGATGLPNPTIVRVDP